MRRINWRPTPAMGVAFVALLAALTGTAVALPGSGTVTADDIRNNSVGSADVRNNSIKSRDIKNNTINGRDIRRGGVFGSDIHRNTITGNKVRNGSLTSADLRNDSVTGDDVQESSLGLVPGANFSHRAGSARGVDSQRHVGPVRLSFGQSQTLLSEGPFTIIAKCADGDDPDYVDFNGTGEAGDPDDVWAALILRTSTDNNAAVTDWWDSDGDFDSGDQLLVSDSYSGSGGDSEFDGWYSGWMAITPDGNTQFLGERAYTGARVGGGQCYFGAFPVF